MDPWQTSVEKRLDSLDARLGRVEVDLGQVKVGLATMAERVNHLPTKDWITNRLLVMLAVIAALTVFADNIRHLVGLSH